MADSVNMIPSITRSTSSSSSAAPAAATSATPWSQLQQASATRQAEQQAEEPSDSIAMATLKKRIAQIKKQIAEQQQQLRDLMAEPGIADDARQSQARGLQHSIMTLQGAIAQAYQSMQKLLDAEQKPATGSQVDTQA
ncbi:hypothetical protein ACLB90_07485 [Stenotrophomonas sp. LGBM10]|uniref:hypothetical protein n=1 Tax=Stenotrophomonas sp. LGBM10 TaxID=3390038 RepID=UPI00398AC15F